VPLEFETETDNEKVPVDVGVPDNVAVEVLNDNPVGNVPLNDQVNGASPVAENV
jgi:hypothetical protein